MIPYTIKRERVLHGLDVVIDSRPLRTFDTFGLEVFVCLEDYKWIGCTKDYDFYHIKRNTKDVILKP